MATRVVHSALPRCHVARLTNPVKDFVDVKSSLTDHGLLGRNRITGLRRLQKSGHRSRRCFIVWESPYARNRILFEPYEVPNDGIILLSPDDSRARHITTVLRPPFGASLKIGIIDGRPGTALVEGDVKDGMLVGPSVRLQVTEWGPQPTASRLSLLLAMPRPKAMRRLWSILGQLGLAQILIINAARVERFYFDSQTLLQTAIRNELLLGLEQVAVQAADTRLPGVTIHKRLKPLLEQICSCNSQSSGRRGVECCDESEEGNVSLSFCNTVLLLAHPGSPCSITEALEDAELTLVQDSGDGEHEWESSKAFCLRDRRRSSLKVLLAVGPEGGWTPFELTMFEEFGFRAVGLGNRPLRTDVALVALISQIKEILQDW